MREIVAFSYRKVFYELETASHEFRNHFWRHIIVYFLASNSPHFLVAHPQGRPTDNRREPEQMISRLFFFTYKKLAKRSKCNLCKRLLTANEMDLKENHYLKLLSRGSLTVPSMRLAEYASSCFAILDYTEDIVRIEGITEVRSAYTRILDSFAPKPVICCSKHAQWGLRFASKIIINSFYNNKETVAADSVRKDGVVAFKKTKREK